MAITGRMGIEANGNLGNGRSSAHSKYVHISTQTCLKELPLP